MRWRVFVAGVLIGAGAALGQVRENHDAPRQVEYRSPDRTQVLTIDYDKGSMSFHPGDGLVRWSAVLTAEDREWAQFWVSDRGWVVRVREYDLVTIREPERGEVVWSVSLLKEFAKHGWSKHVRRVTDRPPLWETHALWAFREMQGASCFVVRPWWGDRVIIDLAGRKLIDDWDEAREEIVRQEQEWVMSELQEAAARACPDDREPRNWKIVHEARMAAHLAGLLKVKDAVEALRALEKWDYTDKSVSSSNDPVPGIDPLCYRVNTLRQAVQLSLHRLGESPVEAAAVSFDRVHPDREGEARFERVRFARPELPRPAAAKSVRVGMTVMEVGELMGGPDGVVDGAWEYDIESGGAKTMRVLWKGGRVSGVERAPPRWREGTARDEEFLY